MIRVSVLVPICNVEKFLPECLDSLVNQTLEDIEIICINDGSTDKSPDIIEQYAKKDKRIKVIDKKNSGYGDSMNKGLEKARGEYIGIVEPDDFIDLDAFEKMYNTAKQYNCEVVKSNFYEYYGEEKKSVPAKKLFKEDDFNQVLDPHDLPEVFYQPPCIWAAIYKRSFLEENDIKFLPSPGASYQDTGFCFKVWAMAHRVYFMDRAFLHYRQDNANSSVKDSKKVYCVKDEYDNVEKYLKERGMLEEMEPLLFTCRMGGYIWNLKRLKFEAAMEFSDVVAEEYHRAERKGLLKQGKLDAVGAHNARLMAVRHPKAYVIMRPLHELRNALRDRVQPVLSKAMQRTMPRYRQRIQTMNTVKRLREEEMQLVAKVARLEAKMGEKNGSKN